MPKIPVSVFIITKNEEAHLQRALQSCQDFSEIIVVDSGSTDNTIEIAKTLATQVIQHKWLGYAKQKQYAMGLCANDWVLNLDADEELTVELIEDIRTTINMPNVSALKCRRNDFFCGQFFPKFTRLPTNTRLFRASKTQYLINNLVHEGPEVEGKIHHTNKYFRHYGYSDIELLMQKYNHYSSLKAQEKYAKGKKPSILKLAFIFPIEFLRNFLAYRFVFSGARGFIFSMLMAKYAFLKEAKLYQLTKTAL